MPKSDPKKKKEPKEQSDKPKRKSLKKIVIKAAPKTTYSIPVLKLAARTSTEIDFTGGGELKIGSVEYAGGTMRVVCKAGAVTSTFVYH